MIYHGLIAVTITAEPLRTTLVDLQRRYNDSSIKKRMLAPHVTLLPPGQLQHSPEQAAAEFGTIDFYNPETPLTLNDVGIFKSSRAYSVHFRCHGPALQRWREQLKVSVVRHGHLYEPLTSSRYDWQADFTPHVTLAYATDEQRAEEVARFLRTSDAFHTKFKSVQITFYSKTPGSTWSPLAQKNADFRQNFQ